MAPNSSQGRWRTNRGVHSLNGLIGVSGCLNSIRNILRGANAQYKLLRYGEVIKHLKEMSIANGCDAYEMLPLAHDVSHSPPIVSVLVSFSACSRGLLVCATLVGYSAKLILFGSAASTPAPNVYSICYGRAIALLAMPKGFFLMLRSSSSCLKRWLLHGTVPQTGSHYLNLRVIRDIESQICGLT